MKLRSGNIPSLDGLRALSIVFVLIGHVYHTIPSHTAVTDELMVFIGNAGLGVTTFFVISGYLITRLLRNEWEKNGGIFLRGFYLRRALRIFPAFYVYLGIMAVLAGSGIIATSSRCIIAAGTFVLNYNHFLNPMEQALPSIWFIGHFWTLALEEQFYLLWPLTLVTLGLLRARRVALVLIFLCPLLRVLTYYFWPEGRTQTAAMLPTAADSMMMGGALALYEGEDWFEVLIGRLSLNNVALLAGIVAFFISPVLSHRYLGAYDLPLGRSINALSISIIILHATRNPETPFGRLLNCRLAVFIGTLSYSLYLWQQPFLTPLNTTWSGRFPLNIIASLVVALISYHLVEKPFLQLKKFIPAHPRVD